MTLDFTPTDLRKALSKGCLTHQQRIILLEILENNDILNDLIESIARLRRSQHSPVDKILLAAILLGFEAGLMMAPKAGVAQ